MHPTKEDLVSALLEFIDDKDDYARRPTRPTSSKPTKESVKAKNRRQLHVDYNTFRVNVFKPYAGDLFSQRDHTDGLIYLSRQSIRHSNGNKAQAPQKSARTRHNTFLSSEFLGMAESKSKKTIETEEQAVIAERQRMQWHAIVVEIFRYSIETGDEVDIVQEGALRVIEKINHGDQVTTSLANLEMATYCAATALNLACNSACRSLLMPPQQMIVAEALNVISTHHSADPVAMLLCVVTLGYLSVPSGGEDAIISTCLATLGAAVNVDSTICRKAALATLANLFVASERNQMVEHILPMLKALAALNEIDSALLVLCATYNLSFYDLPRVALVEGGLVVLLGGLLSVMDMEISPGAPEMTGKSDVTDAVQASVAIDFDGQAAFHMLAECVLNLSCTIDARERMIRDGAVSLLVELEQLIVHDSTKEVVGLAMANLTVSEVAQLLSTVVEHGAISTLVSLAESVQAPEARNRISTALCNLSSEPQNRERMVREGSHCALIKLSNAASAMSSCQPLILVAFINLLAVSESQCAIVDAGLLPLIERLLAQNASDEVKRYCGMALANIADDLSIHSKKTHETVIAMMTKLASSQEIELLRTIASAFAMYAYILAANAALPDQEREQLDLTDDVARAILGLCFSSDARVLKFGGMTLINLSQETDYHQALFRNGVAAALLQLAASRDDEGRRMCACTMHSLTTSREFANVDISCVQGLIKVLGTLESCRLADVINLCAASLFSISCMPKHSQLLSTDSSILRRLFGMMRGGQESTQLFAARAVCNLTCDEPCVKTLLCEDAVADFIAIAILRTNNEEVKGVCAECLFNLIRYDRTRPQLLREPNNVLWAISRLFRYCIESERTQRIGALVVYNLSCNHDTATTLMRTINAAETLTTVASNRDISSRSWAAAALYNLSWTPEFAAQLVNDAASHRSHVENGVSGVVRVLRKLVESDLPEALAMTIRTQCATTLYNMSQCADNVCERLINDGVTVFIELLLETNDFYVIELACIVCFNISLVPGCEGALVDYQVVANLMSLLRRLAQPPRGGARSRFPQEHASIYLLTLGTLYNLTIKVDCRSSLETAGVSDTCITVGRMEDTPQEQLELVTAMLQNLSFEAENHRPFASKICSLMETFGYLVASPNVLTSQLTDIASVLCNLSCTTALGEQFCDAGMIDLIAQIVLMAKNSEAVLNLCATALRNISNLGKFQDLHASWAKPEIEPMMKTLAQLRASELTEKAHLRLDDVVSCLYNVLITGASKLPSADSLSSILTALFKLSEKPETRSLCAAALLARRGDEGTVHYSDGSVTALHSAMQAEIAAYDAEIVAAPRPLKPDKHNKQAGLSKEKLGTRFSMLQSNRSTVSANYVVRSATTPEWKSFAQDANAITKGSDVPTTMITKLPKNRAHPPKSTFTKTSGQFRKILFYPSKVRSLTSTRISGLVALNDQPDEPVQVPVKFDFAEIFKPLS